MKVVVAMDSFKGCMTSLKAAKQVEAGIKMYDQNIEVVKFPIGDGGEGTLQAFHSLCNGELVWVNTTDAYGKKIESCYSLIDNGQTAVMEVANIIGLSMHDRTRRDPLHGSSYGVGTVLLDAYNKGVKKIIIGLGGSATNDCGLGLLQCLGARFYDANHQYLSPMALNLENVKYIDFNRLQKFEGVEIIAACDVKNHLLGEDGATYTFGKQKGLFPNQMKQLEDGMFNFRFQVSRYMKIDLNEYEGGGAAGGLGAILMGIFNAKMIPGIDLLVSYSNLKEEIATCDLVITGEGQSDYQTMYGKVPVGILNIAKEFDKPVLCLSGALGLGYMDLYQLGFIGIYSIADRAMTFQQALDGAGDKLMNASYSLMATLHGFKR